MRTIPASELPINPDGSIFHLHLLPEQVSDKIILVGDPGRVAVVASFFDSVECEVASREFKTITGSYRGKRITVLSHGIGTDNIDIVLTELDALKNVDLATRTVKPQFTPLTLVRIGTSGGLQPSVPVGTFVIAEKSIGFDGVLHYYAGADRVSENDFVESFYDQTGYSRSHARPYVVSANAELVNQIGKSDMVRGVTISANGFYGPQGRYVRVPLADPSLNEKIELFSYNNREITNYEMESSALAGLSLLLGHKAMTVCCIIANRVNRGMNVDYQQSISLLVEKVLDRI